ncbi:MAG: hypothetical protein JST89_13960 [Cyanobacteria bacterium SZAS-4]|nr:hypothetical protein [Cyanobacteria bacterium SZAS-4]
MIHQKYLDRLIEMGLWHSEPIHLFNGGVRVRKPIETTGNNIAGSDHGLVDFVSEDSDEAKAKEVLIEVSDAPMILFYHDEEAGKWVVSAVDGCGGMLPGDFVNTWDTAEEALKDIEDFYFGDPARMNAKVYVKQDF